MGSDDVAWIEQPQLDGEPVMLCAFSGWNDAGEASSEAIRFLRRRFRAHRVGTIDCEPYYDFASVRPIVRLNEDNVRRIEWPSPEIGLGELDDGRPVVTLSGIEPRLRWRRFSETVVELVHQLNVSEVVTLGGLLAEKHHSEPVGIVGSCNDVELRKRLDLAPSKYEGATGIIGVLNDACHRAGVVSVSFWAAVPAYLNTVSSPKATLALVERVSEFLDVAVPQGDLQRAAANFDKQVNEIVESDERLREYADDMLKNADRQSGQSPTNFEVNPDTLMTEVEQFLRQQDD